MYGRAVSGSARPDRPPRPGPITAIADAARYPRPVWGSERAYVLASIAGVVGLGNLWRFPYMAGLHGGGSFLLAYVICVVAVAIPLAALESAAGNLVRRSPVGAFRSAGGRPGALVGWTVIGVTVAILSYYFVVTGWTLGYALDAFRDRVVTFRDFTDGMASLWLFLVVGGAVYVLLLRDVGAIERASLVLLPLLVVIVAGLAIYSLTLDGAGEARAFYLEVDSGRLADPSLWTAAAGQAFYSIGIGQGVLIAYGSYVPSGTNLIRSTALIAGTNSGISIVAGLMVFGFVFNFDLPTDAGSELSFTVFPRVFPALPAGEFLAVAFFVLLFVAGFTSCLGGAVVVMAAARDELHLSRRVAARWVVGVIVLLGVPSALSFTSVGLEVAGEPFLDRVDRLTGSGVVVVLGLLGAGLLARRLPTRNLAASFDCDEWRLGPVRLGPRTLIGWAAILPVLAAASYVVAAVL